MKKRIQLQQTPAVDNGRWSSPRTGDHCPANGWWAPLNDAANAHFVAEGSIMPSVDGQPTIWKLVVRHSPRTQDPTHDFPSRGFALDSI